MHSFVPLIFNEYSTRSPLGQGDQLELEEVQRLPVVYALPADYAGKLEGHR